MMLLKIEKSYEMITVFRAKLKTIQAIKKITMMIQNPIIHQGITIMNIMKIVVREKGQIQIRIIQPEIH